MVVDCDSRAERTEVASRRPEEPKDVVLTIDKDFQIQVDTALGDVTGSAVVIDPRTGGILALVSHPAYDPNWFVTGMTGKDRDFINDEKKRPLLNRAAEAAYPTGSIFKVITMAAAMHDLGYTRRDPDRLPAGIQLARHRSGLARLDLRGRTRRAGHAEPPHRVWSTPAIPSSTRSAPRSMSRTKSGCRTWRRRLDWAHLPESRISLKSSGTVPSPEWKLQDVIGDYWARGDAVNMAIGQGFVEATPLADGQRLRRDCERRHRCCSPSSSSFSRTPMAARSGRQAHRDRRSAAERRAGRRDRRARCGTRPATAGARAPCASSAISAGRSPAKPAPPRTS